MLVRFVTVHDAIAVFSKVISERKTLVLGKQQVTF